MQGYDYDHRTASASQRQLLGLIVERAVAARDTRSLVRAYIDAAREDFEEEEDLSESTKDSDRAFDVYIQMVKSKSDVEKLFEGTFARVYRTQAGGTREEALEAMDTSVSDRFIDDEIPSDVVIAVATALARRDAAEAIELRREYLRRHPELREASEPATTPEVFEKGTELVVHMKHGDWWSEMKRGAVLIVTDAGKVGGTVKFKERWDIMRMDGMEAKVEPAKNGMFKLTLTNDRFRRALTVKLKT